MPVFSLIMCPPPPVKFLRIIYGAPSDQFLSLLDPNRLSVQLMTSLKCLQHTFTVYSIYAPRSLSSLTIWGPPQVSFFVYYMRALSDQFFCLLCGGPSNQMLRILYGGGGGPHVSFFVYYRRPPQISLFAYYMVPPPSGRFLHLLYVGAPLDKFLRLLYGPPPPSGQFLRLLYAPPVQFLRLL